MKYNDTKEVKQPQAKTTDPLSFSSLEKSSLGNATKLPTPPEQPLDFVDLNNFSVVDHETGEIQHQGKVSQLTAINEARTIRFNLQDAARNILFRFHGSKVPVNKKGFEVHHRTCSCTRFRTGATAQIVKSKTNGKAFFNGLMSCANSRTCPVCSAKISERKSNEMRIAFNIARAEKREISLLTFTAPHNSGDTLEDLKQGISKALELFWTGATAKRFKEKYGILGHIRSFEIRHGDNGWHPHFHIIIFSNIELPNTQRDSKRKLLKEQSQEWLKILERWKSCCVRSGLSSPNMYGMDIQNGAHAGEYISKFGSDDEILQTKSGKKVTWDMADEMTKGNTKTGRKGSSSPWDLLSNSIDPDLTKDEQYENKKLFLFYARSMQGVNLIRWSRGLRSMFDLGAQDTDEEIIAQEQDRADLLCHVQPHEWSYIIKNKKRDIILQLAESNPVFDEDNIQIDGGHVAVARLLFPNSGYDCFNEFLYDFKNRDQLVDYVEIPLVDVNTTPIKTGKDLSFSSVKKEFKGYLTNEYKIPMKRPIFKAIDERKELQKEQLFFTENKDLLDFAKEIQLKIKDKK